MRARHFCPNCGVDNSKAHGSAPPRRLCRNCGKTWTIQRNRVDTDVDRDESAPGVTVEDNQAVVVSHPRQDQRPTVEAVLSEFNLDSQEWIVDKAEPKQWDAMWKDDAGVGHVVTMYALKLRLFKRQPEVIDWPEWRGAKVRPIKPRKFAISRQLVRRVMMPDCQVGYWRDLDTGELDPTHDEAALDCFAEVVKRIQPDGLDHVGDGMDCTEETDKFVLEPEFYFTMQPSLDYWGSYLAHIRKYVGPREAEDEFRYLEGNHEERLVRTMLRNHISAARLRRANAPKTEPPVLSVPFLLGLADLQIQWIGGYPKNRAWITDDLQIKHAGKLSQKPGACAGNTLEANPRTSTIFGHSHRLECAHLTAHPRDHARTYGAYNIGTLSRIDGRVPSNTAEENWQQGFAVVDYEGGGHGDHSVQLVNIYNGRCIFEGRKYEAADALQAAG